MRGLATQACECPRGVLAYEQLLVHPGRRRGAHVHAPALSEDRLADVACVPIRDAPRARVLIGGLGLGFT